MASTLARGGAESIDTWYGSVWESGYLIAGADGTVTGKAVGDSIDHIVTVLSGTMLPIIWGSISDAPAGSVVVW